MINPPGRAVGSAPGRESSSQSSHQVKGSIAREGKCALLTLGQNCILKFLSLVGSSWGLPGFRYRPKTNPSTSRSWSLLGWCCVVGRTRIVLPYCIVFALYRAAVLSLVPYRTSVAPPSSCILPPTHIAPLSHIILFPVSHRDVITGTVSYLYSIPPSRIVPSSHIAPSSFTVLSAVSHHRVVARYHIVPPALGTLSSSHALGSNQRWPFKPSRFYLNNRYFS